MELNPTGEFQSQAYSNQEAGELGYLYTSQSLLEGYFQTYSFFSSSSQLYEDSRNGLVAGESPLARKSSKEKKAARKSKQQGKVGLI